MSCTSALNNNELIWLDNPVANAEELDYLLDPFFQDLLKDPSANSFNPTEVTPDVSLYMLPWDKAEQIWKARKNRKEPIPILDALTACKTKIPKKTQEILKTDLTSPVASSAKSNKLSVSEIKEDKLKKLVAKIAECWEENAIHVARHYNDGSTTELFKQFWGARLVAYHINSCLSSASESKKYRCYVCIDTQNDIQGIMLTSKITNEIQEINWLMTNPANLPTHESFDSISPTKGVGNALIAQAEQDCVSDNFSKLFVRALESAKVFYQKLGFINQSLFECPGMLKTVPCSNFFPISAKL